MINDGRVYSPQELLLQRVMELLKVPKEFLPPALERLTQEERIRPNPIPLNNRRDEKKAVSEEQGTYGIQVIYLTPLYFGEKGVAEHIKELASSVSIAKTMNHNLFPTEELSPEQ